MLLRPGKLKDPRLVRLVIEFGVFIAQRGIDAMDTSWSLLLLLEQLHRWKQPQCAGMIQL